MGMQAVDRIPAGGRLISASAQSAQADPLLWFVRQTVWVAFVLAIANGVFLYFFPQLAEAGYAWAIKPPVSAAFMGAGYLSGVLATGLTLFAARYWRSVWALMWPFFTIGVVELLATVLHADRFRWDYWLTWVWAVIYAIIPPSVVLLWFVQQKASPTRPPVDAQLAPLRPVSWVLGGIVVVFGALLFLTPETFIPDWPWQVTPLLARAFAAWYLQMGVTLLFAAFTLRQPHEAMIPYSWLAAINALVLLLPALHTTSMRAGATEFWVWLSLHLVLFSVGVCGTIRGYLLMKMKNQHI